MAKIHEVVDEAGRKLNKIYENGKFAASEINKHIEKIGGYAEGSILPSDYCYNRINKAPYSCKNPSLELVEFGVYKYIGLNAKYSGIIYWKPKGGEIKKVGEWKNGAQILWEDPRNIK